jgi:sulfur carrier protein
MKIQFNGEGRTVQGRTLAAVLEELGLANAKVATAVNSEFVPAAAREGRELSPGDRIEALAPMMGG